MLKRLLVVSLIILSIGALGCAAAATPTTTTTKTFYTTATTTTVATSTVTTTKTTTTTKTINETQTATVTETYTKTLIRVKRVMHGHSEIVTLDMDTEYLPVVVACENHVAPDESLKAQAIASRTFAFYKILHEPRGNDHDILDYEVDQVYDPAAASSLSQDELDRIFQAVYATRNLVIWHAGNIICSFYVSGGPAMLQYVTFNEGKSGDDVVQTTLDWGYTASIRNPYNRGCMGQIQANQLAVDGYGWEQILKYFYGSDIYIQHY